VIPENAPYAPTGDRSRTPEAMRRLIKEEEFMPISDYPRDVQLDWLGRYTDYYVLD